MRAHLRTYPARFTESAI